MCFGRWDSYGSFLFVCRSHLVKRFFLPKLLGGEFRATDRFLFNGPSIPRITYVCMFVRIQTPP